MTAHSIAIVAVIASSLIMSGVSLAIGTARGARVLPPHARDAHARRRARFPGY